jgi:hypothetical protein
MQLLILRTWSPEAKLGHQDVVGRCYRLKCKDAHRLMWASLVPVVSQLRISLQGISSVCKRRDQDRAPESVARSLSEAPGFTRLDVSLQERIPSGTVSLLPVRLQRWPIEPPVSEPIQIIWLLQSWCNCSYLGNIRQPKGVKRAIALCVQTPIRQA